MLVRCVVCGLIWGSCAVPSVSDGWTDGLYWTALHCRAREG